MTVEASNAAAKPVHPFFAKRSALDKTKDDSNASSLPNRSSPTLENPPRPSSASVDTTGLAPKHEQAAHEKLKAARIAPPPPPSSSSLRPSTISSCPAESSRTAAKRYARYRQAMRERIEEESKCEAQRQNQGLSPMEQLLRDFYGCLLTEPEPDTIPPPPCYRPFHKGAAVWPDQLVFEGGHIPPREPAAPDADTRRPHAYKLTTAMTTASDRHQHPEARIRKMVAGSAYLTEQRALRTAGKQRTTSTLPTPGNATVTLSRERLEQLMDSTFRSWRTSAACRDLFDALFDDSAEDNDDDDDDDSGDITTSANGRQHLPWSEKYRPRRVSNLLGNTKCHAYVLKWLCQRKVRSKQEGAGGGTSPSKRARVAQDESSDLALDQLTLEGSEDSDSEGDDDDDDDDDEDFAATRSRKRERKQQKKKPNMLLLFGPHGVGKTASVYTAAHELGYDVFEINAGSRRSGKDLVAAVGEMSNSHQVNFAEGSSKNQFANLALMFEAESKKRQLQEEQDRESAKKRKTKQPEVNGKGSIMGHFFKLPKAASSPEPGPEPEPMAVDEDETEAESGKKQKPADDTTMDDESKTEQATDIINDNDTKEEAPASAPKQSVILIEEADVLYEEDKGFWPAMADLAHKSKRPIIMTCNDFELLPSESFPLEKAIELRPPSLETLAPYLQLLCLNEGYIIDPLDLVHMVACIGCDIRQLVQTLEVLCKQPDIDPATVPKTDGRAKRSRVEKSFVACRRMFARYMELDDSGNTGELSKDEFWNKINMPLLSRLYTEKINNVKHKPNVAEAMWASDMAGVVRALDTASYVDAYISGERNPEYLEQQTTDQLAGYSGSLGPSQQADAALQDLSSTIMALSIKRLKNHKWQQDIREGAATWGELCDARTTAFLECTDASMRLLNWRVANVPDRSIVMTEYVPFIRVMCRGEHATPSSSSSSRRGKRRPARRKRNWELNQEEIATLTQDRAITNTTQRWHEQAIKYTERWNKPSPTTSKEGRKAKNTERDRKQLVRPFWQSQ